MTTRHQGYVVVLDTDLREDDAEQTLTALRMVRGVLSVEPIEADGTDIIARAREGERWRSALVRLVQYGPDIVPDRPAS